MSRKILTMKKILIVDDSINYHALFSQNLKTLSGVKIVRAFTPDDFSMEWDKDPKFDLIFMDGCLNSQECDTVPLIEKIRATSKCPIIASSSLPEARQQMMQAGCDYEFDKSFSDKEWLKKSKKFLGIK